MLPPTTALPHSLRLAVDPPPGILPAHDATTGPVALRRQRQRRLRGLVTQLLQRPAPRYTTG